MLSPNSAAIPVTSRTCSRRPCNPFSDRLVLRVRAIFRASIRVAIPEESTWDTSDKSTVKTSGASGCRIVRRRSRRLGEESIFRQPFNCTSVSFLLRITWICRPPTVMNLFVDKSISSARCLTLRLLQLQPECIHPAKALNGISPAFSANGLQSHVASARIRAVVSSRGHCNLTLVVAQSEICRSFCGLGQLFEPSESLRG